MATQTGGTLGGLGGSAGPGLGEAPLRQRDLADIAGTWVEDDEFPRAIKDQHRIDRRLWR